MEETKEYKEIKNIISHETMSSQLEYMKVFSNKENKK